MSIETLAVAVIAFVILWMIIQYVVPEPPKRILFIILYVAGGLWILTHIRALLHLQLS